MPLCKVPAFKEAPFRRVLLHERAPWKLVLKEALSLPVRVLVLGDIVRHPHHRRGHHRRSLTYEFSNELLFLRLFQQSQRI